MAALGASLAARAAAQAQEADAEDSKDPPYTSPHRPSSGAGLAERLSQVGVLARKDYIMRLPKTTYDVCSAWDHKLAVALGCAAPTLCTMCGRCKRGSPAGCRRARQ